jgi:hypothetical protein
VSAHRKPKLGLLAIVGVSLMLAGCTSAGPDGGASERPTWTPDSGTAAPTVLSSESPSVSPSPPTDASAGCPANGGSIPGGADVATIEDVDGDSRPDTEFYAESPQFEYGIQTASGATIVLGDDLAGPATHTGWSAPLESEVVVTVLDDDRTATLHAFVDCAFVTTKGVDGNPYRFLLNGFGDTGTGVACSNGNGGRQLLGLLATRGYDNRYDITKTLVHISKDGTEAVNGYSSQVASGLPADDPQVAAATASQCANILNVHTSGQ